MAKKEDPSFTWDEAKRLMGKTIKEVREFHNGHFDEGFLLFFNDGTVLSAQDGEYGDNAFKIISLEEARKKEVTNNRVAGIL